jgi:hypothetical protein
MFPLFLPELFGCGYPNLFRQDSGNYLFVLALDKIISNVVYFCYYVKLYIMYTSIYPVLHKFHIYEPNSRCIEDLIIIASLNNKSIYLIHYTFFHIIILSPNKLAICIIPEDNHTDTIYYHVLTTPTLYSHTDIIHYHVLTTLTQYTTMSSPCQLGPHTSWLVAAVDSPGQTVQPCWWNQSSREGHLLMTVRRLFGRTGGHLSTKVTHKHMDNFTVLFVRYRISYIWFKEMGDIAGIYLHKFVWWE